MAKNPAEIVSSARQAFNSGKTKNYQFRLNQLKGLKRFVENNENKLVEVLAEDNRKPKFESYLCEIFAMKSDIQNAIDSLREWMEPQRPSKPLPYIMDQVLIYPEPYGVALIIGAWNYPFLLTISPLVGAIAAGNCAILKPSEISPSCAKLLEEELSKYLDPSCYYVVNGGVPETTALLEQRFDYIFYTGNTNIGKIVYGAAAKFLTPVTLELGGKCPLYLDDSADVDVAANRIMWGKCTNAGQSCIEPDYILCSEFMRDKFVRAAKNTLKKWYGDDLSKSADYCRIVNDNHFKRISKLLEGKKIAMGGRTDPTDRFIEPTILVDLKSEDDIMQEEIFGPVLPIITVATPEEAIEFISKREKPLAVYVFSTSKLEQQKFIKGTTSGSLVINDVMTQFACETLPFGGVGNSGMGRYHGRYSFKTFSHEKATLIKKLNKFDDYALSVRYPPYSDSKLNRIAMLTKKLPGIPGLKMFLDSKVFIVIFGVVFTFLNLFFRK